MQLHGALRMRHNFTLDAYTPDGAYIRRRVCQHNLVTNVGLDLLRNFLFGDPVTGLNYFALGSTVGNPIQPIWAGLGTERFRDVFTQKLKSAPKQLTIKQYVSSQQANGYTYTEAGLFGNGATAQLNSGTFFAGLNFTGQVKTTAEAWTITWVIDIFDDGV